MKPFASVQLALAVAALAPGVAAAQRSDSPRVPTSTADGIFTMEQAREGSKVFLDRCLECHLPEQFAGEFMNSWDGAPVAMLYDAIATTMPADRPGALPVDEYSAVLAYIFLLNGIPAGERKLEGGSKSLAAIYIERSQ
jgi:hypothetical protein